MARCDEDEGGLVRNFAFRGSERMMIDMRVFRARVRVLNRILSLGGEEVVGCVLEERGKDIGL